jgi:RimJ/RimL family protein N-acetyltransferase
MGQASTLARPATAAHAAPATSGSPSAADIPIDGVLCRGMAVEIGWPREDEFDRLTALRNRPHVRSQFFDSCILDVAANREWMRNGMRRPYEALLAIRTRDAGELCGMIGWTGWCERTRSLELGRIVVDGERARAFRTLRRTSSRGIGLDAGIALRDYLFATIGVHTLRTRYYSDNRLAARVNRLGGGRVVRRSTVLGADGRHADVVELELTRADWLGLRRPAEASS